MAACIWVRDRGGAQIESRSLLWKDIRPLRPTPAFQGPLGVCKILDLVRLSIKSHRCRSFLLTKPQSSAKEGPGFVVGSWWNCCKRRFLWFQPVASRWFPRPASARQAEAPPVEPEPAPKPEKEKEEAAFGAAPRTGQAGVSQHTVPQDGCYFLGSST